MAGGRCTGVIATRTVQGTAHHLDLEYIASFPKEVVVPNHCVESRRRGSGDFEAAGEAQHVPRDMLSSKGYGGLRASRSDVGI